MYYKRLVLSILNIASSQRTRNLPDRPLPRKRDGFKSNDSSVRCLSNLLTYVCDVIFGFTQGVEIVVFTLCNDWRSWFADVIFVAVALL